MYTLKLTQAATTYAQNSDDERTTKLLLGIFGLKTTVVHVFVTYIYASPE